MNDINLYNDKIFETIKHIDENGNEYWEAREFQKVLEYAQWRRFVEVIKKSMTSCKLSNVDILDWMGSTELAANLFRITQTEDVLNKKNIKDEKNACDTHYKVGKAVRRAIQEIGGTMPEELPAP